MPNLCFNFVWYSLHQVFSFCLFSFYCNLPQSVCMHLFFQEHYFCTPQKHVCPSCANSSLTLDDIPWKRKYVNNNFVTIVYVGIYFWPTQCILSTLHTIFNGIETLKPLSYVNIKDVFVYVTKHHIGNKIASRFSFTIELS